MNGRRGLRPLALAVVIVGGFLAAGAATLFLWNETTSIADGDGASRRVLVVLYANETTTEAFGAPHYRKVLGILQNAEGDLPKALHADLVADAREFPKAVARNLEGFLARARRGDFDFAFFSNELANARTYLLVRSGQTHGERLELPFTHVSEHPFVATAPLSDPRMFRAALLDLTERYRNVPLDVILLTFSHGALGMALMPRVNIDLRIASEGDIRRGLEGAGSAPAAPGWASLQGTANRAFWDVLEDVGVAHPDVRFPLVVRGSCQSTLASLEEYSAIPATVGLIGHTGVSSPSIKSFRLEAILADQQVPFSRTALARNAREAGFSVDRRWSLVMWLVPVVLWNIPFVFYCIPLTLWLALVGWGQARARWLQRRPKPRYPT